MLALIAGILALAFLGQGSTAAFQKDAEPQSAQWIQSVVTGGRWLLPRDYYGSVDRKPPLFYWLSALVTRAAGGRVDELKARSVSLMAGAALAAMVLMWTRTHFGTGAGWLSLGFLLGSYGFASRAALALTDMLMTLILLGGWFLLYPQIEGDESQPRTVAIGLILGLGVLTKGPVVLIIAALGAALYLLMVGENPLASLRRPWPWVVLAIAIGTSALWYVPAAIAGGRRFLSIVAAENLGHFLPPSLGGTGEAARPLYHIVGRFVGGAMPVVLLLPAVVAAFFSDGVRPAFRRPLLFQASLMIAVLGFFSLASAKRDDYILPALPGTAILCASLFSPALTGLGAHRIRAATLRDTIAAAIAAVMVLGVGGAVIMARISGRIDFRSLGLHSSDVAYATIIDQGFARFEPPFVLFATAVLVGAAMCYASLRLKRARWIGAAVGLLACTGSLLWIGTVRPTLAARRTLKPFAAEIRERIKEAPLYIVRGRNYELSFYYGRMVPPLIRKGPRRALGPAAGYLVAYPGETNLIGPEFRGRLSAMFEAGTIGGPGPPTLYRIEPPSESMDLNTHREAVKQEP